MKPQNLKQLRGVRLTVTTVDFLESFALRKDKLARYSFLATGKVAKVIELSKTTNMAAYISRAVLRAQAAVPSAVRTFSVSLGRPINEGPNFQKPTHTGQLWDKDDYRNIRFVDHDKHINPMWAVDLIAEDPVVVVEQNHVWSHSCGALGHPKVYINLDKPEIGTCGYSGRKFIQKKYYDSAEHGPSITHEEYLEQMKGDSR